MTKPVHPHPQKQVTDERCAQIIDLATSVDTSLAEQASTIASQADTIEEQAETIAAQAAEIERLQAIIDAMPQPPEIRKPDLWVLPSATGDGSGSSPENCAAYSTLATLAKNCGPDKVIGLLGDRADWPNVSTIKFTNTSGQEGAPILIRGTDEAGQPYRTELRSSRPAPLLFEEPGSYPGGSGDTLTIPRDEWAQGARDGGTTVFQFDANANWLSFSHLNALNIKAMGYYASDCIGHCWSDIDLYNVQHAWWMSDDPVSGSPTEKCIQQMLWERFKVEYFEEDVFRWFGTSHHLIARDFEMHSKRCMGNITFGFAIGYGGDPRNDVVTDWEIARGKISSCHDTAYEKPWCSDPPTYTSEGANGRCYYPKPGLVRDPKVWSGDVPGKKYWNGDGISVERNCDRGLIEDVEIYGCTDGGIDCKASDIIMRRVVSRDNKRNYRLWGQRMRMEECTSDAGRKRGGSSGVAHVWLDGADGTGKVGCELALDRCTFKGTPTYAFSIDSAQSYGIKVTGAETCTFEGVTSNVPAYKP